MGYIFVKELEEIKEKSWSKYLGVSFLLDKWKIKEKLLELSVSEYVNYIRDIVD